MHRWLLPSIGEILAWNDTTTADCQSSPPEGTKKSVCSRNQMELQWQTAIAALEQLLLQTNHANQLAAPNASPARGVVLAGPAPVLSQEALLSSLPTWIFTGESLSGLRDGQFQLPPADVASAEIAELDYNSGLIFPLLPGDPLAAERFCLILTAEFSLMMALGKGLTGAPEVQFSFEPEVVEQGWHSLRARIELSSNEVPLQLDNLVTKYRPVAPDYRTVTQFSRLLLKSLPEKSAEPRAIPSPKPKEPELCWSSPDVELLQAFAHEVRTPLTTIRTLTRLLLKRRDLAVEVQKRLKIIDHECTEQINRMELLFRAAELEKSRFKQATQLTAMSLAQVLQQSIPRWQSSASRRNLTLDVTLPQQLPTVVSDPTMLDQVLTSLIENFTRSLPAGSHIQVHVIPAGDQLKLQLLPQSQSKDSSKTAGLSKSLGPLLMFQPETGSISLNLTATKHLFQAIGGKLIVRQKPHQGEVLTIFLPLEIARSEFQCASEPRATTDSIRA